MLNNTLLYLKNNTEFLSLGFIHMSSIMSIIILTILIKRYNLVFLVSDIKLRFETTTYVWGLALFIVLNILDTAQPLFFILYFILITPYIIFSQCNEQTKIFLLLTFNICYSVSTHLNPFLNIQKNEIWAYVLVILCICVLLLWFNWIQTALLVLFIAVLNFFVLSCACLANALDLEVMPLYVKICFILLSLSIYIIFLLTYFIVTRVYCMQAFRLFCIKLNTYSRLRIFLVSISIVILSLCLRNIYLYNIFVYQVLAYLEIVVLLTGTKNPHHEWMCGPGVKHLFGSHCRKMSNMLIYKQHQHDQMNRLYHEIKEIKKDIVQHNIPPESVVLNEPKVNNRPFSEKEINVLDKFFKRTHLRHYACLVEKNDGSKCVSHMTHGSVVDNKRTVFVMEDPKELRNTNIIATGFATDEKYASDVLPDIEQMQDDNTRKMNKLLNQMPKDTIDKITDKIEIDKNRTITQRMKEEELLANKRTSELLEIKSKIKNYKNDAGISEVD